MIMKRLLFQTAAANDRIYLLFVFCLSALGSHSFQVAAPVQRRTLRSSTTNNPLADCRSIASALLSSKEEDEHEGEFSEKSFVAGTQNATTALLMDSLTDETFEMDLGATSDNNQTSVDAAISNKMSISEAPPLSFSKFLTMQGKRVIVTVRYSGDAGLKPYFLTAAKKIKAGHPDVILERRQMADVDKEDPTDGPSFEILVDGKVIVGNDKSRPRKKIGSVDLSRSPSIFVSMQELDLAISRARRRRRPSTTVYGEVHEPAEVQDSLRLERLREGDVSLPHEAPKPAAIVKKQHRHEAWND